MSTDNSVEVAQWYTLSRRFPQLVGRTADGAKIPGGPYTYTQVFTGVGLLLLGLKTTALWARFGSIENVLLLVGICWGATWVVGKLPVGGRTPLSVCSGVYAVWSAPASGTYAGRRIAVPRPQRAGGQVVMIGSSPRDVPADPVDDPAAGAQTEPISAAPGRQSGQLSAAQRLLAGV